MPRLTTGKMETYSTYIRTVLHMVHADIAISNTAKVVINSLAYDVYERLVLAANTLRMMLNKQTLGVREIETAVRQILPGELAKHAMSALIKAVTRYADGIRGNTKVRISRSKRAQLIFPVARIEKNMRITLKGVSIGESAAVAVAAVLEYIVAEVLELSGNSCRSDRRKRILPKDVLKSIKHDEELDKLLHNVAIPQGGISSHIQV